MRLYRFCNRHSSSIRTILVARGGASRFGSLSASSPDKAESRKRKTTATGGIEGSETSHSECSWGKSSRFQTVNKHSQKMQLYNDGEQGIKLFEVDSECAANSSTFEYNMDYRMAECQGDKDEMKNVERANQEHGGSDLPRQDSSQPLDVEDWDRALLGEEVMEYGSNGSSDSGGDEEDSIADDLVDLYDPELHMHVQYTRSSQNPASRADGARTRFFTPYGAREGTCRDSGVDPLPWSPRGSAAARPARTPPSPGEPRPAAPEPVASTSSSSQDPEEKYLLFTTGLKTYTPHQVGIKKILPLKTTCPVDRSASSKDGLLPNVSDNEAGPVNPNNVYDTVDHLIELNGHIIGMCLSPDHR